MQLMLVKKQAFNNFICDIYTDKQGNVLMTREQIGRALGYKKPSEAIAIIHSRNKERLDKFSIKVPLAYAKKGGRNLSTPFNENMQETILYTRRGVYEICRYSQQPKANDFYDWVYDLLEGIAMGQIKLTIEKTTEAWQAQRIKCKEKSKELGEAIKLFVDYATAQGSKHAKNYYTNFNKLINGLTDIYSRDNCDLNSLTAVYNALNMAVVCIHDGIKNNSPYKLIFKDCKERLTAAKNWGLIAG